MQRKNLDKIRQVLNANYSSFKNKDVELSDLQWKNNESCFYCTITHAKYDDNDEIQSLIAEKLKLSRDKVSVQQRFDDRSPTEVETLLSFTISISNDDLDLQKLTPIKSSWYSCFCCGDKKSDKPTFERQGSITRTYSRRFSHSSNNG